MLYFNKELTVFDIPVDLNGTPFQIAVWNALMRIPYGDVISYQTLANRIGNTKAVRAVGAANGRNPVSIVIPCHRVIGFEWHINRLRRWNFCKRKSSKVGVEFDFILRKKSILIPMIPAKINVGLVVVAIVWLIH